MALVDFEIISSAIAIISKIFNIFSLSTNSIFGYPNFYCQYWLWWFQHTGNNKSSGSSEKFLLFDAVFDGSDEKLSTNVIQCTCIFIFVEWWTYLFSHSYMKFYSFFEINFSLNVTFTFFCFLNLIYQLKLLLWLLIYDIKLGETLSKLFIVHYYLTDF